MRETKPKTSPTRRVIVVIHVEIMAPHGEPSIDEMVLHVSSNWRTAEKYIRETIVAPYSWWKLQQFTLDRRIDDPPTRLYSHTGRKLKNPPYRFAIKQWEKWQKREEQ